MVGEYQPFSSIFCLHFQGSGLSSEEGGNMLIRSCAARCY